jgi:hypothetical protein
MKCRDFEELLSAYADGELPRTQREFIEKHLAGCADCRRALSDFEAAGRQLASLKRTTLQPDISGATLSRIKSPLRTSMKSWPRLVTTAVAILAVIILVLAGQTWASPEAIASSIVRNSPEVKAALDGEEITTVEVTTSIVDQHGDVLMLVIRTEDRALTAEVNLRNRTVTNVVRVNVPDFQSGDEQKALEIAEADPRVRELLERGGIVTGISLFKSINPDPTSENPIQDGTVTLSALVTIDVGGQDWNVVVDLDAGKVVSAGKTQPSSAMILVYAGRYARDIAAPVLLVLGILLLLSIASSNRFSRAMAGVFSLVMGLLSLFIALYALSSIWWRMAFNISVPAMALVIGITTLKQKTAGRGLSIAGTVTGALALALVLFNEIMLPGANTGPIVAISIVIAAIIIYAFKEKIMAVNHSGKVLRPVLIGVAAVAVLVLALAQPWSSPLSPQALVARANEATSGLQSYRMSLHSKASGAQPLDNAIEVAYASPDRFQAEVNLNGATAEFISIDGKIYRHDISGTGSEYHIFPTIPSKQDTLSLLDWLTDLETLPDVQIDGVDCLHFRGKVDLQRLVPRSSASPNGQSEVQMLEKLKDIDTVFEIWIGKDDYLIRRIYQEMRTPVKGPTGEITDWNVSTSEQKYYDFNAQISVEAPLTETGELLPGWSLKETTSPTGGG